MEVMLTKSRHRALFDTELFTINGEAIEFRLDEFDVVETATYNKVIEAFGGKLTTRCGPRTVVLINPDITDYPSNCYDIQFIKDSVLTQKLQKLEDYRVTSRVNKEGTCDGWKGNRTRDSTMNSSGEYLSCQPGDDIIRSSRRQVSSTNSGDHQHMKQNSKLALGNGSRKTYNLDKIKQCIVQLSRLSSTVYSPRDLSKCNGVRKSSKKVSSRRNTRGNQSDEEYVTRANTLSSIYSPANPRKSARISSASFKTRSTQDFSGPADCPTSSFSSFVPPSTSSPISSLYELY